MDFFASTYFFVTFVSLVPAVLRVDQVRKARNIFG